MRKVDATGTTLTELVVASALLIVLLALVYFVLERGLRVMHRADADTRAQQQAALAGQHLFAELAYSDYRTLTVQSSPPAVSCLSLRPPEQAGLPPLSGVDVQRLGNYTWQTWPKFTAFYLDQASRRLLRRDFPYAGGQELGSIYPDALPGALSSSVYPARVVARGIEVLEIATTNTPGLLRIVLVGRHDWDRPRLSRLEFSLAMRN